MSNTGWAFGITPIPDVAAVVATSNSALVVQGRWAYPTAAAITATSNNLKVTEKVNPPALIVVAAALVASQAPPVITDPDTVTQMYLPATYAFFIHVGDTCRKQVQYVLQGTPTGLPAGCTVEWRFTMPDSSEFVATESSGNLIVDRPSGTIRLSLSSAETTMLAGIGRHALKVTGTRVKALLLGDLVVTR